MKIPEKQLEELLKAAVQKLYSEFTDFSKLFVQRSTDEQFGDYATNFAMSVSKILRKAPKVIADEVSKAVELGDILEKVDVAGPGFINLKLRDTYLAGETQKTLSEPYDFSFLSRDGDIVIDYSSPNIAKRMHIGHLRSTVIGDSIKRVLKYLGYNVIADNHIGDWGTQFGKLTVAYRGWLDKEAYAQSPVAELERIYVEFDKRAEENPALEDMARAELKKLQDGEEENIKLWKQFVLVSLEEYQRLYTRMDIQFDTYHGESFFHERMPAMLDLLKEKGLAQESEGALVVFFDEKEGIHPCIVQKKDGAFLYATSDLACIKFKLDTYKVNRLVYVTDDRQQAHFKQVFRIAEMLGWNARPEHIIFGVMKFQDGVFSSRKGNVIRLEDLLDESVTRARAIIEEKNPALPDDEKGKIAEAVGVGAIKYADLSQNRLSQVIFEWDKALSFDGNTAPYLQYTYARIQSIKRKAADQGKALNEGAEILLSSPVERSLASLITLFPSAVIKAAEAYKPNIIADYLFELAQKFNTFYNSMPVLKEESSVLHSRLLLSHKTGLIIKAGLDLLGIRTVERM